MYKSIAELREAVAAGNFKALARAITVVENRLPHAMPLLECLQGNEATKLIGITGPPGAGKSTIVSALTGHWVEQGKRVAVLAIDPSSPFNYGALLGDRIRMYKYYTHPQVFIRSLATRGALGGLNATIIEIADVVKEAGFDYIVIETVGVGQSEVEIAGLADCTLVALVPEAGDEIQTWKAGLMEIADIFVLNKADRPDAEAMYRALRILTHEKSTDTYEIPIVKTEANTETGIAELVVAIDHHLRTRYMHNDKHIQLLAERSKQLILAELSKALHLQNLPPAIAEAMLEKDFNLYRFTKHYLETHLPSLPTIDANAG